MNIQELINEFTDCHDKERLKYLTSEIERQANEHIMRCYDITNPDKKDRDTNIKILQCDTPQTEDRISTLIHKYRDLTGNEMAVLRKA